ncbi:hypothetical protein T4B_10315 [Trichinella pseudospiralis]|uniref:Protein quiver n=1 Tax=Trichinella pseudospiralis TaxID=6337 RepID=A0A0V1E2I2_TRIPS|nr:hypothetical protein T4E_4245 [Trichinella pseudospiralis]KRY67346.1 hypothetical protein T4A_2722 [Trichinella pseudospiralis]KRY67347.1 hypothetical protein T4A_2722 [Trichinella pseudospiralis]KRZ23262.1 hypothetical protein T4B_10315 [Trichinella pseudospiralis]
MGWTVQGSLLIVVLVTAVLVLLPTGFCLTCYVCSSINRSDPYCEDTFNTDYPGVNYLQPDCMAYRKDRRGYFPADHCIKVSGVSTANRNFSVVVRTCAMDSGSLTADTEIVRMSHCGHFILDEHYFSGCVQTCSTDGCNLAIQASQSPSLFCISMLAFIFGAWLIG